MNRLTPFIFFLVQQLPLIPAGNIVMFPGPLPSYVHYHRLIGQSLLDLGHQVWICVPGYLVKNNDTAVNRLSYLSYGNDLGDDAVENFKFTKLLDVFWSGDPPNYSHVFFVNEFFKNVSEAVLGDSELENQIQMIKPDLFILDSFTFTRHVVILPYKLDVPFAIVGFHYNSYLARVPFSPAEEPYVFPVLTNKMGFTERIQSTIIQLYFMMFNPFYDNGLVRRYAPSKPLLTINEIILRAEVFVVLTDHVFDHPRPMLPNTKFIGGSSVSEASSLTGEVLEFVRSAANGVAVVSFGSGDMVVPESVLSKMAAAFLKLDMSVVWKVNWTSDQSNRLLILKWMPQNDLLGHPKTRLFISHCGRNGVNEALYHGVPVLCFPIFADQHYNAEMIFSKGFGLYADIRKISAEEMVGLIQQVDYDPLYRSNAQKASKLFKELYKIPSKEAAYWFDHVMKYGGDYMRSAGQQMPLYQFLLMDVLALFMAVTAASLSVLVVLIKFCLKIISSIGKAKSKND